MFRGTESGKQQSHANMLCSTGSRVHIFTKTRVILTKRNIYQKRQCFPPNVLCKRFSHAGLFSNGKNSKILGPILRATSLHANLHRDVSLISKDNGLVINLENTKLQFPYIWLRDHCRCETCYNHVTSQRNGDSCTITPDIAPRSVQFDEDGRNITLQWQDGHVTEYDTAWLVDHSFSTVSKSKTPLLLWDKKTLQATPLPVVSYEDRWEDSEDGLRQTLYNLLRYGFSIIDGVQPSIKETQTAVEKVTFLQETTSGQIWSHISDLQRRDRPYTNLFLGPHTDTSYLSLPTGISAFHCLWHDGRGGDILLVDGFHCAEQFCRDNPEEFEYLTKTEVSFEHKFEDKHRIQSHGTLLTDYPGSGEIMQIRFNPYEMAPIDTIPPKTIPYFYSAYSKLASYIRKPDNEHWLKLHPGMVLLVNNWRVLHGRADFTGRRVICGCYLSRDDWMNKARVFNLV